MRILLVHPELPTTSYWGMQYSLPLVGKTALMPSLGLLTVAAMLPQEWSYRYLDINCEPLTDEAIAWADVVFFSAMIPQRDPLFVHAARCRSLGKPVVFGGPYPTSSPDECSPHCDTMVTGEIEGIVFEFARDLAAGSLRPLYSADGARPEMATSPTPRFDLVRASDFAMMPVQLSRGCPFQCEFCNAPIVFGRKPRVKNDAQVLAELDAIFVSGYRGLVFIVDDNLIGNKKEFRRLVPELERWNDDHGTPFAYTAEASLNLADDDALLTDMARCNFVGVFLGVETPSLESLRETKKLQNTKRSLLDSIEAIQRKGLIVSAGLIIGFDSDSEDIFDRQIEMVTQAAIPSAMAGLLFALPGTPLHERMEREGRLDEKRYDEALAHCGGTTNIHTRIDRRALLEGFGRVVEQLYSPPRYFERCFDLLARLPASQRFAGDWGIGVLLAAARKHDPEYREAARWFVRRVRRELPAQVGLALGLVVAGVHARRLTAEYVLPELARTLAELREASVPAIGLAKPPRRVRLPMLAQLG